MEYQGLDRGTTIRNCEPGEAPRGFDCPADAGLPIVLDFSGYEEDGGDCPIKVFSGAKVTLNNFRVLVRNPEKAVCTGNGQPIPLEDPSNPFAFLHNVTIIAPNP